MRSPYSRDDWSSSQNLTETVWLDREVEEFESSALGDQTNRHKEMRKHPESLWDSRGTGWGQRQVSRYRATTLGG